MKSDIEIARETPLLHINGIADQLEIPHDLLMFYGKHKAKLDLSLLSEEKIAKSNLILVTAISPTKAGNGKTVTTVSLALGLNKIGKKCTVALREPSLGPVFGMKGGAAGGGYAQVLPMEDINLHFTGDFHAITSANNTIAALLDNYQYNHLHTPKALKQITWRRVLDVNDRSLRFVNTGMGGRTNGVPQETGFDITPASEIMAVLCLSKDLDDLRSRIDRIVLGFLQDNTPFTVKDLDAGGAVTVLLKDAILPNLVQTTENTPAIIHGGPFANIAHGCNSVIATRMAMSLSDYVVTEAGFGSDLGAEKFLNIKCRTSGLVPKATVLVVTTQALKTHAGLTGDDTKHPNLTMLKAGMPNMERHIENLQTFGQPIVVALNKFYFDAEAEISFLRSWCREKNIAFAVNDAFANGGAGATELANEVVKLVEEHAASRIHHTYDLSHSIQQKTEAIATQIYRAGHVEYSISALSSIKRIEKNGWAGLPVCIAKTQYSFTDDPTIPGAPSGHTLHIRDVVANTGAGFVVAIAGDIMRMPGLPKAPAASQIDLVNGQVEGLS